MKSITCPAHGNHFWKSFLCMLNHNFYRNICKGCSAPQMRQDLDQYSHRNGTAIKHKKVISECRNSDSQISGFVISSLKNIQDSWGIFYQERKYNIILLFFTCEKTVGLCYIIILTKLYIPYREFGVVGIYKNRRKSKWKVDYKS